MNDELFESDFVEILSARAFTFEMVRGTLYRLE